MVIFRFFLLPFSWIFGLILKIRHRLYDNKWLQSTKFEFPVLVIGNLETGGTGKTPLTILCAELLRPYKPAILSRGYGRKTTGYHEVDISDGPDISGDEPLLIKNKLPEFHMAVCERRTEGIKQIKMHHPETGVIILDDAFQHRKLNPGFSILLFDYASLCSPGFLLPTGNRRDLWERRLAADVIVITKCPEKIDKNRIKQRLHPNPTQKIFYARYKYLPAVSFDQKISLAPENWPRDITLVTGIANARAIKKRLTELKCKFFHFNFPDHHRYEKKDIDQIKNKAPEKSFILTTEKDFIKINRLISDEEKMDWYFLPIEMDLDSPEEFRNLINEYVRSNRRNS